ncbi:hypothetical protein JKP75_15435 [Blastococcus sp. TML/M2B]|uniref:hypothetical protein n=1 Tax=unclassified Blastococcus TaxID=2619396 RepID=UPI00190A8CDD|nr:MULTISPECIES: hypothetical protein [unclassified Blastococcus]MBN1093822.1 hypothetical protein [Blastococcus sp. TML/M2B]MBN1096054.1 hypothetical protein [Blastococcus sp. TML/C7B]
MTAPVRLAVHIGRDVPDGLNAVLSALPPGVQPVAASEREALPEGVVAHLYCSDVRPRRPVAPYAVWWMAGEDAAPAAGAGVPVLADAGHGRPDDLQVSLRAWPEHARPVLPFTRAGLRRVRELPARLVGESRSDGVSWGVPGEQPAVAARDTWPTLAALASAVVATGEDLWTALAWAAPAVTDAASARLLGLTPGEDVLVDDDPAVRTRLAAGLADDELRAAGLARRGWQAACCRRPAAVAAELCRRLGVRPPAHSTVSGLTAAMDELGTPPHSLVRRRARAATAGLPGAVTSGWRPDREEHP